MPINKGTIYLFTLPFFAHHVQHYVPGALVVERFFSSININTNEGGYFNLYDFYLWKDWLNC